MAKLGSLRPVSDDKKRYAADFSQDHEVRDKHTSFDPITRREPKSTQNTPHEIRKTAGEASEAQNAVVLDWDDCLRDEKGLNYQLIHKALLVIARNHARTLPELGEALDRFQSRMKALQENGELPGAGDPLLMKSQEAFTKYLMAHPKISKRPIVEDFVSKMLPDIDGQKALSITNAVYSQFKRLYKNLVNPGLNKTFDDIKPSLMPGARDLLEKLRSADTRTILISNRGHNDLESEVRRLDMMHYFNAVIGAPLVTRPRPGAKTHEMPLAGQERLMAALRSGESDALSKAVEETLEFSHPNTTKIGLINKKPGSARLAASLEQLSIKPDVPITTYGDQDTDVVQAAEFHVNGRSVQGVIVNPARNDVGAQIEVDGVPTRIVGSMTDL